MKEIIVAALYKFASLDNYRQMKTPLLDVMHKHGIRGTLLLAAEGINGTVSGTRTSIDHLLSYLRKDPRLQDLEHKESISSKHPFLRCKVKLKKEIVTLGQENIDPSNLTGEHVDAYTWNELIDDENVLVIDTRNHYEVEIGSFKNAVDPRTENFREFPEYVEKEIIPKYPKDTKIAMFCTGGIRCEKSTAYMINKGYENVYHLKGGILKYLEDMKQDETRWEGECFVFDERVAVDHDLNKGSYEQCHGCRYPITAEQMQDPKYKPGVHCPRCFDKLDDKHLTRVSERQKQIELAKQRGIEHLGPKD